MNKKLAIIGISALLLCGGLVAVVSAEPTDDSAGPFEKLFNRFCDMMGHCRGRGVDIENITGNFTFVDGNFYINESELHFGPIRYITKAITAIDYDKDGENETIYDELQGLVGINITVGAHEQSENWYSVFTINNETYREPGKPIWAGLHTWRWRNNQPD